MKTELRKRLYMSKFYFVYEENSTKLFSLLLKHHIVRFFNLKFPCNHSRTVYDFFFSIVKQCNANINQMHTMMWNSLPYIFMVDITLEI